MLYAKQYTSKYFQSRYFLILFIRIFIIWWNNNASLNSVNNNVNNMLKRRAHNRKAIIYECSSRSFNKSSISFHHSLSFQFYTDQIFSRHILNYKDNFQNIELIYICNITLYNIHLYLYMLLVIWYGLYININDEQFSTRHSSNSNLY